MPSPIERRAQWCADKEQRHDGDRSRAHLRMIAAHCDILTEAGELDRVVEFLRAMLDDLEPAPDPDRTFRECLVAAERERIMGCVNAPKLWGRFAA
jgi:hypothetical protein